MSQWFLDRMDSEWKVNLKRFKDKINYLDSSFCTTDPQELDIKNISKVKFMPNPVDPSLDRFDNSSKNDLSHDIFFAMSHGVHRGVLKKGKIDKRDYNKKLLNELPEIKFDIYGMNDSTNLVRRIFRSLIKMQNRIKFKSGSAGKYYSSDRFSQLIGNGLLVLVDRKTKIGNFFNKNEIVLYNNLRILLKKFFLLKK